MKENQTTHSFMFPLQEDSPIFSEFRYSYCELNGITQNEFDEGARKNLEYHGEDRLRKTHEALLTPINAAMRCLEQYKLEFPQILIFTGPGLMDGHAITLKDDCYAFFDLSLITHHYEEEGFEKETHVLHELTHALHYKKSPAFERLNSIKNGGTHAFRMLIAEGVACALSEHILSSLGFNCEPLWFGSLSSSLMNEWRDNCESLWQSDLQKILSLNSGEEPEINLFSLSGMKEKELVQGRRAYYLGTKLVKKVLEEKGIDSIFRKDESFWKQTLDSI